MENILNILKPVVPAILWMGLGHCIFCLRHLRKAVEFIIQLIEVMILDGFFLSLSRARTEMGYSGRDFFAQK